MMQGKKIFLALFPIMLLGIFLYLTVQSGLSPTAETSDTLATTTPLVTLGTTTSPESTSEALPLPLFSTAGEGSLAPVTTALSTPTTTFLKETEADRAVMAPITDFLPENTLVTEFPDAWQVVIPETTQAPSTLVTGFSGTLPLVLPLAAPQEAEPMRAVYVASAYCLDFPSEKELSAKAQKDELDAILATCQKEGLNTIVFQVRPASDALYASAIFPTSRFLSEEQGASLSFDPLAYLIEKAHKLKIAIHAWINPFRVTLPGESFDSLAASHPAKSDPSLTFTVENQIFYNPASLAVRDLIVDGVAELVARYSIDGILFDDYFYPSAITTEDAASYHSYLAAGGSLSLGDFRRENVNLTVEAVFRAIKALRPEVRFGIAPRGIWRNADTDPSGSNTLGGAAYDEIYCDALAWVKGGYIDYLSPQIYWSFQSAAAPFAVLADWWQNALADSDVALTVSLAAYALSSDEISAQKAYLSSLPSYGGFVLYRYRSLL